MTPRSILEERLPELLNELRQLVLLESPSQDAPRLATAARQLVSWYGEVGAVELLPLDESGPLVRCTIPGSPTRVALIAHYDTVHPVGSWPHPWELRGDRAYGPGIYDTKAGVLFPLWALRALVAADRPHPTVTVLLTPDEEIGSYASRAALEAAADDVDACLVLEPAMPDGSLKLARKATGDFVVQVLGRSAHQGVNPERGVNAVVEAANQIGRLAALSDLERGTVVGPTIVRGGTASNVVPDTAEVTVDVRAWEASEQVRVETAIRSLQPVLAGARLEVTGRWNRPLWRADAGARRLFAAARLAGGRLGLDPGWVALGGGSDANFTAARGTPTLDGLGAVGDDDHTFDEHVVVPLLPIRTALLAELLTELARSPRDWPPPAALDSTQPEGGRP